MSATQPQIDFVRALQRKLSLPDSMLDDYCAMHFGVSRFEFMDVRQCSQLLDRMKEWEQLPAELMRAKGQMDLFS